MTSTKIITFLLGFALVLPLALTFALMVFRGPNSRELVTKAFDEAMATMKQEIDATGPHTGTAMGAVEASERISLHPRLNRVWAVSPRRWIGVVGLCGCALIIFLWGYCSFIPSFRLSGGYAPVDESTSLDESAIAPDRIMWTNESSTGQQSPDRKTID